MAHSSVPAAASPPSAGGRSPSAVQRPPRSSSRLFSPSPPRILLLSFLHFFLLSLPAPCASFAAWLVDRPASCYTPLLPGEIIMNNAVLPFAESSHKGIELVMYKDNSLKPLKTAVDDAAAGAGAGAARVIVVPDDGRKHLYNLRLGNIPGGMQKDLQYVVQLDAEGADNADKDKSSTAGFTSLTSGCDGSRAHGRGRGNGVMLLVGEAMRGSVDVWAGWATGHGAVSLTERVAFRREGYDAAKAKARVGVDPEEEEEEETEDGEGDDDDKYDDDDNDNENEAAEEEEDAEKLALAKQKKNDALKKVAERRRKSEDPKAAAEDRSERNVAPPTEKKKESVEKDAKAEERLVAKEEKENEQRADDETDDEYERELEKLQKKYNKRRKDRKGETATEKRRDAEQNRPRDRRHVNEDGDEDDGKLRTFRREYDRDDFGKRTLNVHRYWYASIVAFLGIMAVFGKRCGWFKMSRSRKGRRDL